jgi:porphobilinogen synthase
MPALALFPGDGPGGQVARRRGRLGTDGLCQRAVRALKRRFPELGVITDVALDPYTTTARTASSTATATS